MLWLEILDALHAGGRHQEWTELKYSPSIQTAASEKKDAVGKGQFQRNKHSTSIYDVPTSLFLSSEEPQDGAQSYSSFAKLSENLHSSQRTQPRWESSDGKECRRRNLEKFARGEPQGGGSGVASSEGWEGDFKAGAWLRKKSGSPEISQNPGRPVKGDFH